MTRSYTLVYILLLMIFVACSSDKGTTTCYSFDERQCRMDEWASGEFGITIAELESEIKTYFNQQGVQIDDITIDPNFHDAVCEACGVCPSGQRVFISTKSEVDLASKTFNLLELQVVECNQVF